MRKWPVFCFCICNFLLGDLFISMLFLEPACDGQHGYQVPLLSIVKKNICSRAACTPFPKKMEQGVVYMSPFWIRLHSKFVCFVHVFCLLPRSWIVCTICNAVPTLFFRLKNFLMRILAFPLRPRYIHCSTLITPDIIEFNWFETTCLLPKSAAVIEVISEIGPELFYCDPFL